VQAVPHDVADDEDGRVLRPLSDQVERTADPLGGGHEGGGQVHSGTLGQFERRERVADGAQVLKLVLGRVKPRTQRFDVGVADRCFAAKARDEIVILLAGADVTTFSMFLVAPRPHRR
jgi:hypothetical protein